MAIRMLLADVDGTLITQDEGFANAVERYVLP
jgi:hypothetical protein